MQLAPSTGQATHAHPRPAVVWERQAHVTLPFQGWEVREKQKDPGQQQPRHLGSAVPATVQLIAAAGDAGAQQGQRTVSGGLGTKTAFQQREEHCVQSCPAQLGAIWGHWGRSWCGERRPEEASPGLQGPLEQIKEFRPDTSVKERSAELRNEATVPSERWL